MSREDAAGRLCRFLAAASVGDLPDDAILAGRRGVLDFLGCTLGGFVSSASAMAFDVLRSAGAQETATALGRGAKLGLLDAALVNGVAAHALDYDDTRGSASILAAAIALAEQTGRSGSALLLAYAVGIEASERIQAAALGHHRAGWHPIGTIGGIAAAAAAANLLRLDAERLTQAVGLAATQAAGLQRNRGTAAKPLHAGKAAANGLFAALLAQRGFECAPDGLLGPLGFCAVYGDATRPEALDEKIWDKAGASPATATSPIRAASFFTRSSMQRSSSGSTILLTQLPSPPLYCAATRLSPRSARRSSRRPAMHRDSAPRMRPR